MRLLVRRFLQSLNQSAADSTRIRTNLNLYNNFSEKVQRLLIPLKLTSYFNPHYYEFPHQWQMFVVIEGVGEVIFYTDKEKNQTFVSG